MKLAITKNEYLVDDQIDLYIPNTFKEIIAGFT